MSKKYIEIFLKRKSSLDLLPFFQSAHRVGKEITESMGCLHAALNYTGLDPKNNDINVLIIGDGALPRTGALFAFNTAWNVVSIDPRLGIANYSKILEKFKNENREVERLWAGKWSMEEFAELPKSHFSSSHLLVVRPHSHCEYREMIVALKKLPKGNVTLIDLPCCIKAPDFFLTETIARATSLFTYKDTNIWSPENNIFIYKNFERSYDHYIREKLA